MIYQKGHLARPLDAVLSAPSRLAVLRALLRARAPMTGRAVARYAGINHQGAAVALAGLESLGMISRYSAGRADQWRLDRRRWIVTELLVPMFEREIDHAEAISAAIKKGLRGKASAVWLGGTAAKGRFGPGEKLELIAVDGPQGRRPLGEALRALSALLKEQWAIELSCVAMSRREAARAAVLDDLWGLLPEEGPVTYLAGITAQR